MRIELEIPKEFEKDYTGDKFKEFFSRVLCDIDRKGACGLYEEETAEMFIKAFDESKSAYNINSVVEELENNTHIYFNKNTNELVPLEEAIEIVKSGGVSE